MTVRAGHLTNMLGDLQMDKAWFLPSIELQLGEFMPMPLFSFNYTSTISIINVTFIGYFQPWSAMFYQVEMNQYKLK